VSEYTPLAKKWVEVTKRVAAGSCDGIVCPKNADADVLIEVREQGSGTDDARFEYWIHCPGCGAEIYFDSKDQSSTARINTVRRLLWPARFRQVVAAIRPEIAAGAFRDGQLQGG